MCSDVVPVACQWSVGTFGFLAGFWSDRISYCAYQITVLLDMNLRHTITAWTCRMMLQSVVVSVIVGAVIDCMCKMIAHGCKLGVVDSAHEVWLLTLVHYLVSHASAACQTQGGSPHGDTSDCVHSSPLNQCYYSSYSSTSMCLSALDFQLCSQLTPVDLSAKREDSNVLRRQQCRIRVAVRDNWHACRHPAFSGIGRKFEHCR